jgi:hypothetical protein
MNRPWTAYDIDLLLRYIHEKRSFNYISKKQNRPLSTIQSKLKSIAAKMYFKDNVSFEKIYEITGISKETIIVTPKPIKEAPDEYNYITITRPLSPYNNPLVIFTREDPFDYERRCEELICTFKTCAKIARSINKIPNAPPLDEGQP